VVPYTRGPEVHRPPANIIQEVGRLAEAGAREVTLLGQTINHYAYAHGDGRTTSFGQLLYEIHEAVPQLPRLRFVTSYPRDFDDEALEAMRDCERICRYLHVPAQHGANRVLKAMNRGYTIEQYYAFIDRARELMPDISLASDFIVGFPTETEEEFQATKDVIRRCRFKNSFIFKYSPRPGTVAIQRFADDVPDEVKKRRNNELLAVQHEVSRSQAAAMVGQVIELMVEGESRHGGRPGDGGSGYSSGNVQLGDRMRPPRSIGGTTQLVGRTRGDQIVVFEGDPALAGELVEVEVTGVRGLTLLGRRASEMVEA
jgi:tRNA-2-methylthio-N6-dimethylallyladenosine synthase